METKITNIWLYSLFCSLCKNVSFTLTEKKTLQNITRPFAELWSALLSKFGKYMSMTWKGRLSGNSIMWAVFVHQWSLKIWSERVQFQILHCPWNKGMRCKVSAVWELFWRGNKKEIDVHRHADFLLGHYLN